MRHARHDPALQAAEKALEVPIGQMQQKYILIVYDGPAPNRDASFISNVDVGDVAQVCNAVAQQIRNRVN